MKILALELSTARGSLAWLNDRVDLAREWPAPEKFGAFLKTSTRSREIWFFGSIVATWPSSYVGVHCDSAAIGLQAARCSTHRVSFDLRQADYCVTGDARWQSFSSRTSANELIEGPSLFTEEDLKNDLKHLSECRFFLPNHCRNFRAW
jgi:hypothetical protein